MTGIGSRMPAPAAAVDDAERTSRAGFPAGDGRTAPAAFDLGFFGACAGTSAADFFPVVWLDRFTGSFFVRCGMAPREIGLHFTHYAQNGVVYAPSSWVSNADNADNAAGIGVHLRSLCDDEDPRHRIRDPAAAETTSRSSRGE
jgi:hypothetical protein